MIGRLVALGAAVAAAAAALWAATWAKRRAAEDAALEQEMIDALDDPDVVGSAPSPSPDPVPQADAAPEARDGADDLTVLKGIGAVSAGRLGEAGVTTFAQLAAWSDEDLERVAEQIKVSPERIRREDWVGQARTRTAD